MWGSTAGIDIDPNDGNIWAYERCGAGALAGAPINCDSNPVDPIFKFDRNTGEMLANFGGGIMVTPHGIHVDREGNVWVTDFAGNAERTKGHQVHKFSPQGELLMSLGTAGVPGKGRNVFDQPNDVHVASNGDIFVADYGNYRIRKVVPPPADFVLDDEPTQTDSVDASITFTDLAAGSYEISEQLPLNWQLASVFCSGGSGNFYTTVGETLTVQLNDGEDIFCTFSNAQP